LAGWRDTGFPRILASMSFSSFLAELRRRHVIRVALGYAAVAFVVGEAADIFLPALQLPGWSVTLVVALLILGFPVALTLAWTLELTPEGMVRDSGSSPAARRGTVATAGAPGSIDREGGSRHAPSSLTDRLPPTTPPEPDAEIPERSIAVLAFTDMSREGDQEYFGDGIAEEIIDALTKLPALRVAARTSSFGFKSVGGDVREIGRKLGVATVLEGSIRKAGERLRITAQLISVADGYHLWSERYDRKLDDIFEIQDEIARAVVHTMRVTVLGQNERLLQSTTDNAEAYDEYLKGRYTWRLRYRLGLDAALQHFKRAIELDPDFAEPWAGVSDTYSVMGIYAFGDPNELRGGAVEAVGRALANGAHLPDVQFAAGLYEYVFGWDVPRAIEHFREAIRLGGRHPRSRAWLGHALAAQGRTVEGHLEAKGAFEEAPDSAYIKSMYGLACVWALKMEEARQCLESVLEREPTDLIARYTLGMIECWEGRHDEAIELLRYVYDRGQAPAFGTFLAGALARAGRRKEADRLMERIAEALAVRIEETAALPLFHAWAGEVEEALEALPDIVAVRTPGFLAGCFSPWYGPVREDPRWAILRPFLEGD